MARSTRGKPNPWDSIPQMPADHPLFKRGFVIGIKRLADFSTSGEPNHPEANQAPQENPNKSDAAK
jgi:hypothetical protein